MNDRPVIIMLGAVAGAVLLAAFPLPASIAGALNSNFVTSLIGALAGAAGGAYAAQRIAEKGKVREWLVAAIRNTNAATMVAYDTCNTLLAVKAQNVLPMKENSDSQKRDYDLLENLKRAGVAPVGTRMPVNLDFETLYPPSIEIELLKVQTFEKLSLGARPLVMVATLARCIDSLNQALTMRNEAIDDFRESGPHSDQDRADFYFGLRNQQGIVDGRYATNVRAISSYLDWAIWYSQRLCKELVEHGERLAQKWVDEVGGKKPWINKPDFAKARAAGLIPPDKDFEDWLKAFEMRAS